MARAGLRQGDLEVAGHYCRAILFENGVSLKWLADNDIPLRREKASGETIGTIGAFLVPSEVENSIISLRDVSGVLRQHATVVTMGSDERTWPRRVGGVSASFPQNENVGIAESQLTFDAIAFAAKKAAASVRLSNELYEDETVGLGAWFVEEISAAFARKEDDCGFTGDGSSSFAGIRGICNLLVDGNHNAGKAAAVSGHNSLAGIDSTDLSALMGILPSYAWPGARWYCSGPGVGLCLSRLAMASGVDIGVAPDLHFAGFPVSIVPSMPGAGSQVGKVAMLFGDLSLAVALGSRRGVTVQQSPHRYFEADQTVLRGTERVDVVCANLGDNSVAGPIVGLTPTT
jgi:HK97 family phage major capsid protein